MILEENEPVKIIHIERNDEKIIMGYDGKPIQETVNEFFGTENVFFERVGVRLAKRLDAMYLDAIIQGAAEEGITYLHLLNWPFILEAITEKMERDVVPVVRCRDCRFSRPPSALTQKYGVPGTLTCTHGACNRRNVGGDFFCADGEEREK